MTGLDVVIQQVVNGLALGMMYALLALGFTMVYGIIELINFSHFSVFMTGTFVGLFVLNLMGVTAVSRSLSGVALVGTLLLLFLATMTATGLLGVVIERLCLRPVRHISGTAPMITTIGVAFILINVMLLTWGPQTQRFPQLLPNWRWQVLGTAEITFKQLVLFVVGLLLMLLLSHLVKRTTLGKTMRATAQDADAARMMGIDVDRVVMLTFFLGSALAGAGSLFFGLYYGFTAYYIGYTIGLRAFTSAVLGGIGSIPGAVLGGLFIGLTQSLGGQLLGVKWTDVIIFSILITVMVLRPSGLLGVRAPRRPEHESARGTAGHATRAPSLASVARVPAAAHPHPRAPRDRARLSVLQRQRGQRGRGGQRLHLRAPCPRPQHRGGLRGPARPGLRRVLSPSAPTATESPPPGSSSPDGRVSGFPSSGRGR